MASLMPLPRQAQIDFFQRHWHLGQHVELRHFGRFRRTKVGHHAQPVGRGGQQAAGGGQGRGRAMHGDVPLLVTVDKIADGALRHQRAPVEHRDPIGQTLQIAELMRGDDDCPPRRFDIAQDLGKQMFARSHVKAGRRFVQQQQIRVARQCHDQRQARALAKGQAADFGLA
jgi:hypothetical protein